MSIPRASAVLIVALTILVCPACDDDFTTAIGPTDTHAAFINRSVFVESPDVQAVAVPNATCPDPLFFVPFQLVISADSSDLFVTQVQMQFVDRFGIRSPERTITRAGLMDRFGSTRIAPAESRRFPLEFSIACGAVPSGTLTVGVVMSDIQQRERRTSVPVNVRR